MSSRIASFIRAIILFLLPLVVLGWTSIPSLSEYSVHLAMVVLLVVIGLSFVKKDSLQLTKVSLQTLTILLLVGATGWFFSPFFFLLYLVPLYLGFLYNPLVAFAFLAALLVIFSFSVGEIDAAYDIMTLLSLLLVIPLVIYLRKKYLILRQSHKDILILEADSGIKSVDTIAYLLNNRVTNLGVTVRQPLTYIKQAATVLLEEDLNLEEATNYVERIRTTATEALDHVRKFEGDTSANAVLTNEKKEVLNQVPSARPAAQNSVRKPS
ncbi:MAG: hypothetical protein WEA04_03400 [Candidatus Andersenbacteria bacterium]